MARWRLLTNGAASWVLAVTRKMPAVDGFRTMVYCGGEDLGRLWFRGGRGLGGRVRPCDIVHDDRVFGRGGLRRHVHVEVGVVKAAELVLGEFLKVGVSEIRRAQGRPAAKQEGRGRGGGVSGKGNFLPPSGDGGPPTGDSDSGLSACVDITVENRMEGSGVQVHRSSGGRRLPILPSVPTKGCSYPGQGRPLRTTGVQRAAPLCSGCRGGFGPQDGVPRCEQTSRWPHSKTYSRG